MSKLLFALVMLFSTATHADGPTGTFTVNNGSVYFRSASTDMLTIKKCRRGHDATPITISLNWIDGEFGHHIEQVEVCPLCYKHLLSREAGY